ncbi:MAG: triose-phosphate isomerase [Phycisphaerales bacterium]
MRTPFVGGNWKMNTDAASAAALARAIAQGAAKDRHAEAVDIAIFPPFPYLLPCAEVLRAAGSPVWLGAQDCYLAEKGAFTGEVSPLMIKDCGAGCVLAGHSERRHVIHEGDDLVNAKLRAALAIGLRVVLCVGEKLEQRETRQTDTVNERQVRLGLRDVAPAQLAHLTIAYEPVWAIGTGKVASPDDAQDAHQKIRAVVADIFGPAAANALRIIYGGSVTPANAAGLFMMPDVDGGLIGGASLKADDFLAIVAAAAARAERAA